MGAVIGLGDNILATGFARGAAARGVRVALGDGRRIIWDTNSEPVFRHNPNIAPPGSEGAADLEWIKFYKGHRIYNTARGRRWQWNTQFKAQPGEFFFTADELAAAGRAGQGFILMEPHVPTWKKHAGNKDWGFHNYKMVCAALLEQGFDVCQFSYPKSGKVMTGARPIVTQSFRDACAILARARFFIGGEGGLHHAAAAGNVPGVVIFGGFIPPSVTGYVIHDNLTGGLRACGKLTPCPHCRASMRAITVGSVVEKALKRLRPATESEFACSAVA